jgi:hypothetical protein
LRVGGVGGCFGPTSYGRVPPQQGAPRHYTAWELKQLCEQGPLDVVLFHDAPAGVEIVKPTRNGEERRYVSEAEGLGEALSAIRPRVCFFGHHHARVNAVVAGIPCLGLNAVGYPGSLIAARGAEGGNIEIVGDWSGS